MLEQLSVLVFKIPSSGSSAGLCGIPHITGFATAQANGTLVSGGLQPPLDQ